ncbi:MAG: M1 family metallopeptidase [Acidimicrobiales bacterium]
MAPREEDHRLPRTAVPLRYRIHLRPDFESNTFRGDERVELQVVESTDELVCNAAELDIHSARLRPLPAATGAGRPEAPGDPDLTVTLDPERERSHFRLPQSIPPGNYELGLEFTGAFNHKLRGFYLNTFVDETGQERVLATTQFQSTDARRAFPCWDEPDRKATFAVELDVPPGMVAVSNGPEVSAVELADGWRRVAFRETPVMSSYIVAVVVGPLEASPPVEVDGVPIRVLHLAGKARLARHALDVAAHALSFFREWFGLPYPGAKLDLIAIPNRGGAMENLGAAIFIESALLIDPDVASRSELQRVTEVIEHEIAHMWFGDLVTMQWWNGLWLNEAFATFMSLKCLDDFRPEWDCWTSFGINRETPMLVDALASTRPIEFPVREPDEAEGMYDSLTYVKGAGVVRMIEQYVGEQRFQGGVRRYLARHQYGNTETSDLWEAIEAAAPEEPVREMARGWIFQGGYPLVTVIESSAGGLELGQEQFGRAGGTRWLIPCMLRTLPGVGSGAAPARTKALVAPDAASLRLDGAPARVIANAGASGFFRVRYTPALRLAVLSNLSSLAPLEQFAFVSDAWATALWGVAPLSEFVEIASAHADGLDPGVFNVVEEALRTFDHAVTPSGRPSLQDWTGALLRPVLERLGWEPLPGESARQSTLRSIAIRQLGDIAEDAAVIAEARRRFTAGVAGRSPLHPATAAAVSSVAAAHGTSDELEELRRRFQDARDPQEEERFLEALSFTRDGAFALRLSTSGLSEMKTPHAALLLCRLMANRHVGPAVWELFKSGWEDIFAQHAGKALWRLLSGVSWLVAPGPEGDEVAQDVREFLAAQEVDGMQRTVDEAIEALGMRLAFLTRESAAIGPLLRAATAVAAARV